MKYQRHKLKLFLLLFCSLAFLLSLFSYQASQIARRLLSLTGELKFYEAKAGEKKSQEQSKEKKSALLPEKINKDKKKQEEKKIEKQKEDLTRQVVNADLPKTEKVYAVYIPDDNFNKYVHQIEPIPELRLYTGEQWTKEKTIAKLAISRNFFFVRVECRDLDPIMLVKEFSRAEGSASAWKDDSVEIFLMKDALSDIYHQFIASASGKAHRFKFEINPNDPRMGKMTESVEASHIATVSEHEEGFDVEFKIPLSLIQFDSSVFKEGFHMQMVRNYRGYGQVGKSATLQLFPVYIYGDNRFGTCNHHHKAFQKIRIKEFNERKDN